MPHDHSHAHDDSAAPSAARHAHAHRHEEEHEEGVPEWMVSFADNTALMMGFFVILLALNLGPKGGSAAPPSQEEPSQAARESGQSAQALDWALSVREGFHNPVDPFSTDPRDRILAMRLRERMGQAQDEGAAGQHDRSDAFKPSDHVSIVTHVDFAPGQDQVRPDDHGELDQFLQAIKGHRYMIEVRGHIDTAEAMPGRPTAMELSFQRALHTAEYLTAHGMNWRQIRIVALGDAEPVRSRAYTEQAHAINRRVEIIETGRIMTH